MYLVNRDWHNDWTSDNEDKAWEAQDNTASCGNVQASKPLSWGAWPFDIEIMC